MDYIARIHSDFPTKFGIPRQSGLTGDLISKIVFEPAYRNPDFLRGIDSWSHLWLLWHFDRIEDGKFSPTVAPPKLGGKTRVGVFATRSPFRPNPIGLSCVKLVEVNLHTKEGPVLYVAGADLADQTPIYDIKPYLPYADCSTGDVDGDGEYEIIVKWTSSEHDVGSPGDPAYSGTVHLAAYKLDGTKLWKNDIALGKNVYSSAHTVQFLVYDFDGDGKSEVMCQTSLGSKDGQGKYVSNAAQTDEEIKAITDEENSTADYRGYGRITEGKEFLTVFNGETGVSMDTINLPTTRGSENGVDYGDDFGNRSNRFVSDIAYLDGEKPYAIYLRGY